MFRAIIQRYIIILWFSFLLVLSGCNLGTQQATPVPTPDIPSVQILSPPNNQQVFAGTNFDIDILASDTSQGIQKIELYVDGGLLNTNSVISGTQAQYRVTMNWLAQGEGFHVLSAVAYRADDTRSDETVINLEVIPRE